MASIVDMIRPSSQMQSRLEELASFLSKAGAGVRDMTPPFDLVDYFKDYTRALMVLMNLGTPAEERLAAAEALRAVGDPLLDPQIEGLTMSASDYVMLGATRAGYQAQWREFFRDIDVIIAPMMLDSAFPHQQGEMNERSLTIDNTVVPYFHNVGFPMVAIYTGLPATAFPGGLDSQGLPLGLQAIGPYLGDRTTLEFARLLEAAWHHYQVPPDFA